MNIAFYISGSSSRLMKFLSEYPFFGGVSYTFVFSDENIPEDDKNTLKNNSIEFFEVEYEKLGKTVQEKRKVLSNLLLNKLQEFNINYCFSFGNHILVGDLLTKYKNRIINFHPSMLPMYPGRMAIDQAIVDDSFFVIGNTAHFIDENVDTGPIILQSIIPIKAFKDTQDYDVVLDIQIEMLYKIIWLLKNNRIVVEKNKVVIKDADYKKYTIFPEVDVDECL